MEQVMLDMIPTGAKAVCHVSQYDIGRTIRFNLISGGAVYTLSGTETVKVYIKKPDGTTAERNIANTSSTYVDWVTGEGDCDQAGKCECELVITSGTTVIGSKNFTVKIEEDPYNDQGVVTETAGPAIIATFTTNVVDTLQEVKCSINPIQNGTPWIDSNEVNKEPYIKRAVAGTATRIGNHLYDKLVGGTVAFNQLCPIPTNSNTQTLNSVTMTDNRDGSYTFGGTATADCIFQVMSQKSWQAHKYILVGGASNGSTTKYSLAMRGAGGDCFDFGNGNVWDATGNTWKGIVIYIKNGQDTNGLIFKPQLIDLTQMLGSTIADYIYSLEQATVGAGVAWFKALFPNDYYAYNAGELMSVKATAHVMKNASNTVIGNYPLDSNLELRGIPKLVNNKLEYDGDTYESNGKVTRKFIKLIFNGSENWQIYEGDGINQLYVYIDNIKTSAQGITTICAKYRPISINDRAGNYNTCYTGSGSVSFNVEGYTVETWKAFLSNNNIEIVCELVTPTTESASPFTNPQVCDENGTEEYTDNRAVAIPVGHETYQANICEITGFDELNIQQTGENLFDKTNTFEGYIIDTNGNFSPRTGDVSTGFISVVGGASYYVKSEQESGMWGAWYNESKEYISACTGYANRVITAPTNAKFVRLTVVHNSGNADTFGINYPATDTDYHSYSGKLIKLEFDDTVYLAEVSCLNGVWKLKLLGKEVDLGTLNYTMYSVAQGNLFRSDEFDIKRVTSTTEVPDIISSIFVAVASANRANHTISMVNNTARIDIIDDDYSDAITFKSAMTGVKLVYPLATPTEITLDETEQFEALLGVNNVWHDGNGNTEVKYLYNA